MQHPVPDRLSGTVLEGRYELGPRLARGGTATVYRARDRRLDRPVAVKLLHPHLAEDAGAAERFAREARAAARLSHPHVVSVLDQGRSPDGTPYLVMELVEGPTLRRVLRERGALPVPEALDVLEALLDGLAAAHRAGLVHRDVKPENVLLDAGGRITVADFGLTRAADQHTGTGTVLGTVGYAAPELVTGRRVDARSDVYAAGVVLFELLAGRRPFDGPPLVVARAHADGPVPDVRSAAPGVPAPVAHLVARATAHDPQDRPADAGRMLEQLRAVRAALGREHPAQALGARPPAGNAPTEVLGARPPGDGGSTRVLSARHVPGGSTATEVLRPGDPTRALGTRRPDRQERGASGSTDPWRPAVELRPARPLRTAGVLAVAALAVAAAAFLGWLLGSGPGAPVAVPDVRGTGTELAEQYLAGAGLRNVVVRESPDPTAPEGTVVGTDPAQGSAVRPLEQVVLIVSTGPEQVVAPDVVGMGVEEAGDRLADAGLQPGERTEVPSDAAAGTVVGQEPAAGTAVARGESVLLAVSAGPRAQEAPGVLGSPVADAVRELEVAGWPVVVEEPLGVSLGVVVAQETTADGVVLTVL
ncbi:Stk1 family PASTA domain-containing Ser/Thr kinase [Kocuria flava]|uniref:Stk1 family PASTA domain-containing Ser/Thr kinase n=1 Tax=Kocuria flava TaxID=446860 RepID=UPI002F954E98